MLFKQILSEVRWRNRLLRVQWRNRLLRVQWRNRLLRVQWRNRLLRVRWRWRTRPPDTVGEILLNIKTVDLPCNTWKQ